MYNNKSNAMKKLILSLVSVVIMLPIFAQSPSDVLFEKYNGQDGYTTVHISQELFKMLATMEIEDGEEDLEEMKNMMENLEYIRILMYDGDDAAPASLDNFRNELKKFDLEGFTELMVVKEDNEEVRFMVQKVNDKEISELLLLINGPDELGFVSIKGLIDMKSISKMSKAVGVHGMEHLKDIHDDDEDHDKDED